jgi:general secretion pathway protein E
LATWPQWPLAELRALRADNVRWSLIAAQQHRAVLFEHPQAGHPGLVAAVCAPPGPELFVRLHHLAAGPLEWVRTTPPEMDRLLAHLEEDARALQGVAAEAAAAEDRDNGDVTAELSLADIAEETSAPVKLLNSTLYDALQCQASDIHLESTSQGLHVRYRIDGVLQRVAEPAGRALAEMVISRLKVLSRLDISERRVPQDGSFRAWARGRCVDLRVSIMPSVHGEDAVIRVLDKQAIVQASGRLGLDVLGFDAGSASALRSLATAPHGMLLVTGPTGSGKTTTLYAVLSETATSHEKVITIEDPVEYQVAGVLQIPVNERKGLTFVRGLRSILRHDPDKIMVGEIRDAQTAEIAVQAALTGHTVLTTVHANSVFDVFGRFTHMGLDPYALASALNGVLAQRLLRRVCEQCAFAEAPAEALAELLQRHGLAGWPQIVRRGRGCAGCHGSGYRGRMAIAEVLVLDDAMRTAIVDRVPLAGLKQLAAAQRMRQLAQAAWDRVCLGETTVEEMQRVVLGA